MPATTAATVLLTKRSARAGVPQRPLAQILCLLALLWSGGVAGATQAAKSPVSDLLRRHIETLEAAGRVELQGVTMGRENILPEFYRRRGFAAAWTDPARVRALLGILAAAPEHGLDPNDYFLPRLKALSAGLGKSSPTADSAARADLDLLLTEALIRYGYQRRFGKVNPETLDPAWNFGRGFAVGTDPVAVLAEAVAAPSLQAYLDAKVPGGPWYVLLQNALAHYKTLAAAGGWQALAAGATVREGERDPRLPALRERLRVEGDLTPASPAPLEPELFDAPLAEGLRVFQGRHGLTADGALGPRTLDALNVPVATRIEQLRMSLERVRWLAGGAPTTYVVVNIAGFRVGYVRDRKLRWDSRVVVGRAARQTPIFRGDMTYIDINPTWTVPPTILREDILPKLRKDPGYLRRENISVIARDGSRVDPASVNWSAYKRGVPYTLRQEPGPQNSLGRIKLMFPNSHSVYLHDTPAKALFAQAERSFSSGCIRVEDPLALAEWVLDDPAWNRAALEAAVATNRTRRVNLKTPVPVLLVYLTATADPSGIARFYRDVYGRDAALLAALDGPVKIEFPALPAAPATASAPKLRGASL